MIIRKIHPGTTARPIGSASTSKNKGSIGSLIASVSIRVKKNVIAERPLMQIENVNMKKHNFAPYVLDGPHGTMDPAFSAHEGPIKYWALAWWLNWFPAQLLNHTLVLRSVSSARPRTRGGLAFTGQ